MSRVEKYSRHKQKLKQETDLQVNHESIPRLDLSPRSKKFISSKQKLSRIFYNLIFVVFLALVIFLFWYGYQNT